MADLSIVFAGIKAPNPFWLASAPPTDKAYNVVRAFERLRHWIAEGGIVKGLADGLEHRVCGQLEGFAGGHQVPVLQTCAGKAHAAHLAGVVQQHVLWLRPGHQPHLIGLGNVLLVRGGAHVLKPAAIHEVHFPGAQPGHLHRHVDGRVARAQHNAALGQG